MARKSAYEEVEHLEAVLLATREELQEKTEALSLEQLKTRNRERQLERGQIKNKRRRKAESDCDSIESLGAVLLTTQEELQEKKEELCLEQLKKGNRERQMERAQIESDKCRVYAEQKIKVLENEAILATKELDKCFAQCRGRSRSSSPRPPRNNEYCGSSKKMSTALLQLKPARNEWASCTVPFLIYY